MAWQCYNVQYIVIQYDNLYIVIMNPNSRAEAVVGRPLLDNDGDAQKREAVMQLFHYFEREKKEYEIGY